MGRIVVTEFVSLDGVMEAPGGGEGYKHAGWTFEIERGGWAFQFERGPEGDQFKLDEVMASDALLLGRVTYEGFAAAWPGRTDDVGFADKFNSMPKYVVSTRRPELTWNNSHFVDGDVASGVAKLKQEIRGDVVVHGSATLVRALTEHDLVDEYRLMVFPVVLGRGKTLFGDTDAPRSLRLVESRPVGNAGVLIVRYEPAR